MQSSSPVHLFDVASRLSGPSKSWSYNTLRTRMVLNFKGIRYTQSWISYPDIAALLQALSVPPIQGPAAYTLPAIIHKESIPSSSGTMNDSFPVALHLDKAFPERPVFPSGVASYVLALMIDKLLASVFKAGGSLLFPAVPGILDDRGREYFNITRGKRFNKPLSEMRPKTDEAADAVREDIKVAMQAILDVLKGRMRTNYKPGPFFEGPTPSYADFILVSFIGFIERIDEKTWNMILDMGDGELRGLWDASFSWLECRGEEKEWKM
ncbi:hypothetical protein F5884DRAFT_897134 [Xylogone sp. PMI_703]|nr:hypothetical protein F5884DRAFT_897134 [Xylogone sp. PMI_703]